MSRAAGVSGGLPFPLLGLGTLQEPEQGWGGRQGPPCPAGQAPAGRPQERALHQWLQPQRQRLTSGAGLRDQDRQAGSPEASVLGLQVARACPRVVPCVCLWGHGHVARTRCEGLRPLADLLKAPFPSAAASGVLGLHCSRGQSGGQRSPWALSWPGPASPVASACHRFSSGRAFPRCVWATLGLRGRCVLVPVILCVVLLGPDACWWHVIGDAVCSATIPLLGQGGTEVSGRVAWRPRVSAVGGQRGLGTARPAGIWAAPAGGASCPSTRAGCALGGPSPGAGHPGWRSGSLSWVLVPQLSQGRPLASGCPWQPSVDLWVAWSQIHSPALPQCQGQWVCTRGCCAGSREDGWAAAWRSRGAGWGRVWP